jgi:alpha-tubulin suppressor-like RCC1 family protein
MKQRLEVAVLVAAASAAFAGCIGIVGDFPLAHLERGDADVVGPPDGASLAPDGASMQDALSPDAHPDGGFVPDADAGTRDAVVQVSCGGAAACAVTRSGKLYCWGSNFSGAVGDGTTAPRSSATSIDRDVTGAALPMLTQVSAGGAHVCARAGDGSIYCWGNGGAGQLGDGVNLVDAAVGSLDVHAPQKVPTISAAFVAAGFFHTCAPSANSYACWGGNGGGELGHLPGTQGDQPVSSILFSYANSSPMAGDGVFGSTAASLGAAFSCANSVTGNSTYCWGENVDGQLGDLEAGAGNTATPAPVAVKSSSGSFVSASMEVAASSATAPHACALAASGILYCWGSGGAGQLGLNLPIVQGSRYSAVQAMTGVSHVAVGGFSTCVVDAATRVLCFGGNQGGVLGHDPSTDPLSQCPDTGAPCNPTPTVVKAADGSDLDHATSVAVGSSVSGGGYACALKDDGTVWCWGVNAAGELGNGEGGNDAGPSFAPVQVLGLP